MEDRIEKIRSEIAKVNAEILSTEFHLREENRKNKKTKLQLKWNQIGMDLITSTASEIQQSVEINLSNLVTSVLGKIFDHPYAFEVKFTDRRGKREADFFLVRNGERIDPMTASGGGVIDILSLVLRLIIWSLKKTTDAVVILDEPFKHVSIDLQSRAHEALSDLARELNLQVILISHTTDTSGANKIFRVNNQNGKATVEEVL